MNAPRWNGQILNSMIYNSLWERVFEGTSGNYNFMLLFQMFYIKQ